MSDDLGADFLKGYFGMAEMRQNQLNRQQSAQQLAQDLQLRQQEFGLRQNQLAEEIKQHAAEGEWRAAQTKHTEALENRQKFADEWTRAQQGMKEQSSGAAVAVKPADLRYTGPTASIGGGPQGLPAMQVPTGAQYKTPQGQTVLNYGNGQFLRPTTPAEQAKTKHDEAWSEIQDSIDSLRDEHPGLFAKNPQLADQIAFAKTVGPETFKAFSAKTDADKAMSPGDFYTANVLSPLRDQATSYVKDKFTDPQTGKTDWDALGKDTKYKGMLATIEAKAKAWPQAGAAVTQGIAATNKRNDNQDYADYSSRLKGELDKVPQNKTLSPQDVGGIVSRVRDGLIKDRMTTGQDLPDYKVLQAAGQQTLREHPKTSFMDQIFNGGLGSIAPPATGAPPQ